MISEYNNSTLRFLRANYEAMISLWTERLESKILPKYNYPIVNVIDDGN